MILENISKYLVVDELCQPSQRKCVHLVSRPFKMFAGSRGDVIYTTEYISQILQEQNKGLRNIRKLFNYPNGNKLKLPDGVKITIRVIESTSETNNVMFLIQKRKENYTLYTGMFNEIHSLLDNKYAVHCIQNDLIDVLYVDNKYPMKCINIQNICEAIHSLIESKLKYKQKLFIIIEEFGYDDIPHTLHIKYSYEIYVDSKYLDYFKAFSETEENAIIHFIDGDNNNSMEKLRKYYNEGTVLIMKLSSGENTNKYKGQKFAINFDSHASHDVVHALLSCVQSRVVLPITL